MIFNYVNSEFLIEHFQRHGDLLSNFLIYKRGNASSEYVLCKSQFRLK